MRRIFKLRNLIFLAAAAGLAALLVSQQSVLDRNIERNKTLEDEMCIRDRTDAADFAAWGNAAASLCIRKRGGIPALPSLEAVEALLSGSETTCRN